MTMYHGKHFQNIFENPKNDDIGESPNRANTNRAIYNRESRGVGFNPLNGRLDFVDKLITQTLPFTFVPVPRATKIFFGCEREESCSLQFLRPSSSKVRAAATRS
jgi:hypothetical protein